VPSVSTTVTVSYLQTRAAPTPATPYARHLLLRLEANVSPVSMTRWDLRSIRDAKRARQFATTTAWTIAAAMPRVDILEILIRGVARRNVKKVVSRSAMKLEQDVSFVSIATQLMRQTMDAMEIVVVDFAMHPRISQESDADSATTTLLEVVMETTEPMNPKEEPNLIMNANLRELKKKENANY